MILRWEKAKRRELTFIIQPNLIQFTVAKKVTMNFLKCLG